MKKQSNLKSLDQFVEEQYGKKALQNEINLRKAMNRLNLAFLFNRLALKKE